MRFLFILLFISTSLSAQSSTALQNQIKLKSYRYLDCIDPYSKNYPTQLIEGLGSIRNSHGKSIGSTGFSIEITRDKNNKVIRILKSETRHYQKAKGMPQKSIVNVITIYLNDAQQPDLAKYISETYISNALATGKNMLYDLQENHNGNRDFNPVKTVLDETKTYIK